MERGATGDTRDMERGATGDTRDMERGATGDTRDMERGATDETRDMERGATGEAPAVVPAVPIGWDRCHAWNVKKRRFCRQTPLPVDVTGDGRPRYCGNHRHLIEEGNVRKKARKNGAVSSRIPCPADPTHLIWEHKVSSHLLVCHAVKKNEERCKQVYYSENRNLGGFGGSGGKAEMDLGRAKELALATLRVFRALFLRPANTEEGGGSLANISEMELYDAIPLADLSSAEEELAKAVSKHRIKVVEMGSGRGMTGLVVSGKISALQSERENSTKLFLIERSGSRAKADTRIRNRADGEYTKGDTLRLDRVDVKRITCDLAHVDITKAVPAVPEVERRNASTLAIAKHLCGAGTDLALKSLSHRHEGLNFTSCVFATCCHGLCNWSDYVGRDCLLELFASHLPFFGERDFAQLARWTAAAVLDDVVVENPNKGRELPTGKGQDGENEHSSGVFSSANANEDSFISIHKVVKELGLACGHRGLGRAVQRVIDHGRCEYIRSVFTAELPHRSHDTGLNVECSVCITRLDFAASRLATSASAGMAYLYKRINAHYMNDPNDPK
ncbi:hypothetical protein THAOC_31878 [Thalassiosira oceanica]|uniref:tRNA:m(4)X modification enzyme TRM13 n=1 Tax=Thalassiosira oceanica TaxID=159749 RepID=K0RAG8_THAOC|nr:hypothetical protein THAOC_31878 [Thalassiosira oceanica]|eukprot:EJK49264.1 hypothetical protein THAOC_31878 [Thalassiosira oceanica]